MLWAKILKRSLTETTDNKNTSFQLPELRTASDG